MQSCQPYQSKSDSQTGNDWDRSLSQSYRNFGPAHLLAPATRTFQPAPRNPRPLCTESIPAREHSPPRQTPCIWCTTSPGGAGYLAVNSVSGLPGHLQTKITCFVILCRHFRWRSESRGFKHRHFGIRRTFIDHKRHIKPIKPFALSYSVLSVGVTHSLCDLFYAVLLTLKQLCLIKKGN